ncbi:MAG TPA: hypothetical protein VI039_02805 [Solirubrobacterales bacterium]
MESVRLEFLPAPERLHPPLGEVHVWRLGTAADPLRRVLAVYLGEEPARIQLEKGEHGKPRLAGNEPPLKFNLSHSGDLALVAVSGANEMGVDVERLRPKREADYYWRWACHEAEVKCRGTGLLGDGQAIAEPIAVQPLDVDPAYAAAIAVAADELAPLRGWTFDPAQRIAASSVS